MQNWLYWQSKTGSMKTRIIGSFELCPLPTSINAAGITDFRLHQQGHAYRARTNHPHKDDSVCACPIVPSGVISPALMTSRGRRTDPAIQAICLGIDGLSAADITALLDLAETYVALNRAADKKPALLKGRTLINLFFEASTRTQSSVSSWRASGWAPMCST